MKKIIILVILLIPFISNGQNVYTFTHIVDDITLDNQTTVVDNNHTFNTNEEAAKELWRYFELPPTPILIGTTLDVVCTATQGGVCIEYEVWSKVGNEEHIIYYKTNYYYSDLTYINK